MLVSKTVPYPGLDLTFLTILQSVHVHNEQWATQTLKSKLWSFPRLCNWTLALSFLHATLALGAVIRKRAINFHGYVDETQLYLYMKPDEITQLTKMEACLKDD